MRSASVTSLQEKILKLLIKDLCCMMRNGVHLIFHQFILEFKASPNEIVGFILSSVDQTTLIPETTVYKMKSVGCFLIGKILFYTCIALGFVFLIIFFVHINIILMVKLRILSIF